MLQPDRLNALMVRKYDEKSQKKFPFYIVNDM